MNDYLIIANGEFLDADLLRHLSKNKTVVALDGAADKLSQLNLKPNVILGDFDSIQDPDRWGIKKTNTELTNEDQAYSGYDNVLIVPAKNQLLTDLTKGIRYCDSQNAKRITIVCALGNRLDHHEGALRMLRSDYKETRPIVIHSDKQTVRFLKNETITFTGNIGDNCGVLAFPKGSFSSKGLVYEADNYPLEFGISESICNLLQTKEVMIKVLGEALIIMPLQTNF